MSKVKNRRLSNPSHIRTLLSELINELRQDDSLDKISKARTIGYLSNIHLSAYRDSELADRVKEIEVMLQEQIT